MKTTTYGRIKALAGDLAGFPRGRFPVELLPVLRAVVAAELRRNWYREAWPELSDHIEEITLDDQHCFSLREGQEDEMGEVLTVVEGGDPRQTRCVTPVESWTRLEGRVHVQTRHGSESVWVEWMTAAPNLLAEAYDETEALDAVELPVRFEMVLAAQGAAALIEPEDPQRAAVLRTQAELEMLRQAGEFRPPWWRRLR